MVSPPSGATRPRPDCTRSVQEIDDSCSKDRWITHNVLTWISLRPIFQAIPKRRSARERCMIKPRSIETVVRIMLAREPRLFVGRGIGQEALDWTRECWERERENLAKCWFSRSDDCILVPLMRGE